MKNKIFYLLILALAVWIITVEKRFSRMPDPPFQPPLDLHVAERDTADKGFSREYGFYMRPYCYFWSDAHTHASFGNFSQDERNRELLMLHDAMYELGIVNSAVFCKTEEDLAFVDSIGKDAPVWYAEFNDPNIGKLRRYHEKYHIRAAKLHNTPVFYGEFNGDSVEFPLGSGKKVPVKIDLIVSPEWMNFFAACQDLGLPVIWHSNNRFGPSPYNFGGDNSACWRGLPYDNFYVLSLIERILETYPKLDLVLCHQGFMGYSRLSALFEKHPNLYIETSAGFILQDGDYLTDKEREKIRPFFIRWDDRILFGTDANAFWTEPDTLAERFIRRHVYDHVHPFKSFIQQLYLPQEALSKVAHKNFERIFKMKPAEDWFY